VNVELRAAAESLAGRAALAGGRGAAVDPARVPDGVPEWYADLLAAVPLAGLRVGVPGVGKSAPLWLEVLDEWGLRREVGEPPAPGCVTFARCAEGGGDRYAFAGDAGDDPPVRRFAPGGDTDGETVCARLSDLLRWAPVLVWDEGRGE
jgi:hypothetical protein